MKYVVRTQPARRAITSLLEPGLRKLWWSCYGDPTDWAVDLAGEREIQ